MLRIDLLGSRAKIASTASQSVGNVVLALCALLIIGIAMHQLWLTNLVYLLTSVLTTIQNLLSYLSVAISSRIALSLPTFGDLLTPNRAA
jgi:hypothetical protein